MGAKPFQPKVTPEEKCVQRRLERRKIPFEPQKHIQTKSGRRYLVDFYIPPKIVVEIGYIGAEDVQEDEDLKDSGYTVLRFRNGEVKRDVGAVCNQIQQIRERFT